MARKISDRSRRIMAEKNAEKLLAMADKFYSMREYEFAWSEAARKLDEAYNLLRDIVTAKDCEWFVGEIDYLRAKNKKLAEDNLRFKFALSDIGKTERGLLGDIMDAVWENAGGDHQPSSFYEEAAFIAEIVMKLIRERAEGNKE